MENASKHPGLWHDLTKTFARTKALLVLTPRDHQVGNFLIYPLYLVADDENNRNSMLYSMSFIKEDEAKKLHLQEELRTPLSTC
jgi:hypothetical protein